MSRDEFTRLFKYMQTEFAKINRRFEAVDLRFDRLESRFDGMAKMITDNGQEIAMLGNKVNRHEKWIDQIADTTKIKLQY